MVLPEVEAVVSKVIETVQKPYVVAFKSGDAGRIDSITFSLSAWQGVRAPEPGQLVILRDIERFEGGLRARVAEPVKA